MESPIMVLTAFYKLNNSIGPIKGTGWKGNVLIEITTVGA